VALGGTSWPAEEIDFATLIRCSSVTHHQSGDCRVIRLGIAVENKNHIRLSRLPAIASGGAFIASSGYYMLFLVRKPAGNPLVRVPSIARIVRIL
jgi:hypothetical protein